MAYLNLYDPLLASPPAGIIHHSILESYWKVVNGIMEAVGDEPAQNELRQSPYHRRLVHVVRSSGNRVRQIKSWQ